MAVGFSKEYIEFAFNKASLKDLKTEVESTEGNIKRLQKSNAQLVKDLNSGGFTRYAAKLREAKKELIAVRMEEEKLQRLATRQRLTGQYGRLGGNVAYWGQRAMAAGRPALGEGARAALGFAGTVGAPLAAGAMISRGLSGTAAAARLDMEFEKLSRTIANLALPAVTGFTNFMNRVNNARDKANGGGELTNKERAFAALTSKEGIYGGAALAAASYMGYRPLAHIMTSAGNAGRFAIANPLMTGGALAMARGLQIYNQDDRISALRNKDATKFTQGEFDQVGGLVQQFKYQKEGERAEWVKRALAANRRILDRHDELFNNPSKPGNFIAGMWGNTFGDSQERRNELLLKRRALERLQSEAAGGKMFSDGSSIDRGDGFNPLQMMVQGAGEKRASSDLHQELAEQIAQKFQPGETNKNEGGPLDVIAEIAGRILAILERVERILPI